MIISFLLVSLIYTLSLFSQWQREILGNGKGDAQRQVTVELDWYLSLCSVLKGATERLAVI